VTLQKTVQRRAAAGYLPLVHGSDNLVQRPVTLLLNKSDNLFGMVIQRRTASAARLGLPPALIPPNLMPSDRGADADPKAFRRLTARRSLSYRINNPNTQIRRIRHCHGSSTWANHPVRLCLFDLLGNPDSHPSETALAAYQGYLVSRLILATDNDEVSKTPPPLSTALICYDTIYAADNLPSVTLLAKRAMMFV